MANILFISYLRPVSILLLQIMTTRHKILVENNRTVKNKTSLYGNLFITAFFLISETLKWITT